MSDVHYRELIERHSGGELTYQRHIPTLIDETRCADVIVAEDDAATIEQVQRALDDALPAEQRFAIVSRAEHDRTVSLVDDALKRAL